MEGGNRDNPIAIMEEEKEDEDDNNDNSTSRNNSKKPSLSTKRPSSSTSPLATAAAASAAAAAAAAASNKRQRHSKSLINKSTKKNELGAPANNYFVENPNLKCPIKLFATESDLVQRKSSTKDHWCYTQCWTLREMLGFDCHQSPDNSAIDFFVVSNFIINFKFLLDEMPEIVSIPQVLVVYGTADDIIGLGSNVKITQRDPSGPEQSSINPLNVQMPWGFHHSKFFIVGFKSGRLRVVIHTSNLRHDDVYLKTQGAFIQDFYMAQKKPMSKSVKAAARRATAPLPNTLCFGETLLNYIDSYQCNTKRAWRGREKISLVQQLQKYDYSTAKGILIPSMPGYHKPRENFRVGYTKVQQVIQSRDSFSDDSKPIVCQYSSIGSLSSNYLATLESAWRKKNPNGISKVTTRKQQSKLNLVLVYPTLGEIIDSVEGAAGGASVPGRNKNVSKPFLSPLYHKYTGSTNILNKEKNVPHIKSYYQVNADGDGMDWFMLTSHNLSKAAWGECQNGRYGETLKVMHWELGVLVTPESLGVKKLVPFSNDSSCNDDDFCQIPLPYPLTPVPYSSSDLPWTVD